MVQTRLSGVRPSFTDSVVLLPLPRDAVVDFQPVDRDTLGCRDAQPDFSSSNVDHLDLDVIADHDGLLYVAR